ncbi:MAG: hypothetical protein HQL03_06105 [Nitrospirae bacterium]|nr:hypothetical protein [Nitrospirota bacterium]MBF0593251.1 hypothetical protein [Nitrospirota bacterium]
MVVLRDIINKRLIKRLFGKPILTVLLWAVVLCGGCGLDAFGGSVTALMTYEKGVDSLRDGNCNRSVMYFKKALGIDPEDKTLRIGMYDFEYTPNVKLSDLQKKCQLSTNTPDNLLPANQSNTEQSSAKQAAAEPLPLPVPPSAAPDANVQQGVELKKKTPIDSDTTVQGTFDENLQITLGGQQLTIARDGSFSLVIALKSKKDSLLLEAQRGKEKKPLPVKLTLGALGLSVENISKINLSNATLSVSGNVAYAGIERKEVQVTIERSVLSIGRDIKIESNLPITVKLRF